MSVISVDTKNRRPIYEQLIDSIKELVLRGVLKPGEQLPGVRTLAMELAINPNTIAKSYAELERLGIIYSLPGRGSFVADDITDLELNRREEVKAQLQKAIKAAAEAGFDKSELVSFIDNIWREQK